MTTVYTIDSAKTASKPLLEKAKKAYGFVPNLLGTMAESPALLEGYMTLSQIFNKTDLSETERQIILLTVSRINHCTYCMAAHTSISQGARVPADVIEALREGAALSDEKLEALRQFTQKVVESHGWPEPSDIQHLIAAGYSQQTVFEVVLGVGMKVLSNYTNHIGQTPLDGQFQANAWSA